MGSSPPSTPPAPDRGIRGILDFERSWWQQGGPKDRRVRERLAMSPVRYHQELMRALDLPEALAYDPALVRRLQRLREHRRRTRLARRLGRPS
ncbi:MAG TPA: DUF3263 domain-containing protein [Actinomycetota bacterium]